MHAVRRLAGAWIVLSMLPQPFLLGQTGADAASLRAESLMVEAMGGRDAWESARFFDYIWAFERGDRTGERHHVWDRWTGRYKLEATIEGKPTVALFDANSKTGRAWIDGEQFTGDELRNVLDRAYAIYINGMYWFVMPFKWRDPGVHLEHIGAVTDSTGRRWETVQLTFEDVGLTPKNRYRAYLDPETHLISWWEHFRTRDDTTTNTRYRWTEWTKRGPIMVSLNRPHVNGGARIYFPRAIISTEVDESAFAEPEK